MITNLDPRDTEAVLEIIDSSEIGRPFEDEGAPDDDFLD